MSQLRDLFHKPATVPIGGVNFVVYKLTFEQFDDAVVVGTWVDSLENKPAEMDEKAFFVEKLNQIKAGTPEHAALERLIAGCLALADLPPVADGETIRIHPLPLQVADVRVMPLVMTAEAVAVLMDVNMDFFLQSLPSFQAVASRIKSIGSGLRSSSLVPATA